MKAVGLKLLRVDAREKVTGAAKFTEDIRLAGMLYAVAVRPKYPHALIKRIDVQPAYEVPGVVRVATASDVPGINAIGAFFPDQPVLAKDKVRHLGDAVALVAAETSEAARKGAARVIVEYEELPGIFSPLDAIKEGAILIHEDGKYGNRGNILEERNYSQGDVEKGFQQADVIIENVYEINYQEHAFLEPEGALAIPEEDGSLTIYGSIQCPYYVRKGVSDALKLPMNRVRIIQAAIGGGFGGKEDVPTEVCARAGLLALLTGRPVLKKRTREESMIMHTKRHPMIIRNKLGATKDGKIVACDVDIISDQGAYASVGTVVMKRAVIHACGAYEIPNTKIRSRLVYTNNILTGAFRGFGAPQVTAAMESQMDELARALNMDPVELRKKNAVHKGSVTATGQKLANCGDGLLKTIEKATDACNWKERRKEHALFNKRQEEINSPYRKGLGISSIMYGVALGKGALDAATSIVNISEDGSATGITGGTEMGQGARTVLSQILAEALGVPVDMVRVLPADTALTQNSGPSVASRVTPVCGEAMRLAALEARKGLINWALEKLKKEDPSIDYAETIIEGTHTYIAGFGSDGVQKAPKIEWSKACYEYFKSGGLMSGVGHVNIKCEDTPESKEQYYTYSFATHIIEVMVDIETGRTKPLNIWAANDVGRAINPMGVEGQIEGGTVQGMGYGLFEDLITKEGKILNPDFTNYIIPTTMDVPNIYPIIVEDLYPGGPYGAKGLGEPSLIPTPAA
ncbi:MAG: xanthine dehydrogenase family protein molybdopterin-binding subunit, partial [Thermoplasmata archaeon]